MCNWQVVWLDSKKITTCYVSHCWPLIIWIPRWCAPVHSRALTWCAGKSPITFIDHQTTPRTRSSPTPKRPVSYQGFSWPTNHPVLFWLSSSCWIITHNSIILYFSHSTISCLPPSEPAVFRTSFAARCSGNRHAQTRGGGERECL